MERDGYTQILPAPFRWFALHVFALSGFALAQPVYSWVSAQQEFLVAHGADARAVLVLVLVLSLGLPFMVTGGTGLFRIVGRNALFYCQILVVGVLTGLVLMALPVAGVIGVLLLLAGAVTGGILYLRQRWFHQLLNWAALCALVFPVYFIATDPARSMMFPEVDTTLKHEEIDALPPGHRQPDHSVVLVMLDELSMPTLLDASGEIDARRFPGFARLAEASTWYPRAATVHVGTAASAVSLVTGNAPRRNGGRNASWQAHPQSLFTLMPSVYGKNTDVHESFTMLCPRAVCDRHWLESAAYMVSDALVLAGHARVPELWRHHLPSIDSQWSHFSDPLLLRFLAGLLGLFAGDAPELDRSEPWSDFLERLDSEPGGFYYHHLSLPHVPLEYLPDGTRYPDSLAAESYRPARDDRPHHLLQYQRHLAQVQYVDTLLAQLLDRLEQTGLWEQSLLIVLADHGRSFREDSHWRILDGYNVGEVLNIPLFIRVPGQVGGRVDQYPASMIDIVPTIADVLGEAPDWPVEGVSLLGGADRPVRDAYPVSCDGFIACTRKFRDRTDNDNLMALGVEEFAGYIEQARVRHDTRLRFSTAAGKFVPAVGESRLLGMPVSELPVAASRDGRYELFDSGALESVDPESGWVPALVGGYVKAPLTGEESLLVSLNGQLAGTAIVARRDGNKVFGALLPGHEFRPGDNDLGLYRVVWSEDGSPEKLIELEQVDAF